MKKKRMNGQEAVEFILISAIVFFGALFSIMVFGGKVAAFFNSDSSVVKVANNTVSVINPGAPQQYEPDYATKASNDNNQQLYNDYQDQQSTTNTTVTGTKTIANYEVTFNSDGSASFAVGNQQVNLSTEMLNLQDAVMETAGAEGVNDLIKEIAYMIEKHQTKYPEGQVPIEILYGDGVRRASATVYKGNAIVNSFSIKVGNNIVIVQKDQECSGSCSYEGTYRIEGTIDSNNKFSGNVTSNVNTYGETSGNYSATVDFTNGLALKNGQYNHYDNFYTTGPCVYSWDIGFNDPSNSFQI